MRRSPTALPCRRDAAVTPSRAVPVPILSLRVWSDVLCPWCCNASVCLDRVREDLAGELDLRLEWKSYLLRPYAEPKPLDRFRHYTQSWTKPASQPDAGEFRPWATDEEPPSHSIPPALAVKAARRQGAFDPYHRALMHAYFARNLNVTAAATAAAVAAECGLDVARFEADFADPATLEEVVSDHREGVELGISGVPCIVVGESFALPGSQDRSTYIHLFRRLLERQVQA
jgi:predicted DsbA family dithiol-disulfide isomerase